FSVVLLLMGAAGSIYGQAAPSDPENRPNVYPVKEPKPDKSRLRDLKGVVKDEADNPIEGAIVSLKDLRTAKVVSFRTKPDGSYLFYDLNMDQNYEVTAKADDSSEPTLKKLTKY